MTAGKVVNDALMAASADDPSSQVFGNIFTVANDADAASDEAGGSMTEQAPPTI